MSTTTTKIKLGRDQVITLDGTPLEGVREVDFDLTSKTVDITSWVDDTTSTLPLHQDLSVRMLIYWQEDYDRIYEKWNKHPPEPMDVDISAFGKYRMVPESIKGGQPIAGVVSWEVTFRSHIY
jgi:hypothetical protein